MSLRLFNSLTRAKEEFCPLDAENVRLYVCGPTVYDYAHIGNARPAIVFDVLYRLLRHVYKDHVKYVRNITDVDDKINARALQEYPGLALNAAVAEVTERTTKQYHADIAALGCLKPDVEPTCTSHIPDMVEMIKTLIAHGCAYVAEGHVLFEVAKAKDYGTLSRRSLDEMVAGARVEVAPYKKNPMDFVLWKPSDAETPGWPSPWGRGRPGWHIECSAMAARHLGKVFDIHGGGIDLQFPHHENELAQTRCAFGSDKMASVWMHNGFLQVEGQKMSKSLGNFVTIHELLDKWHGLVLRFAMLQKHYRQPINWTHEGGLAAQSELEKWTGLVFDTQLLGRHEVDRLRKELPEVDSRVLEPLQDDLNMPEAFAGLREMADEARSEIGISDSTRRYSFLRALIFLGLVDPRTIGAFETGVRGSAPLSDLVAHAELFRSVRRAVANSEPQVVQQINAEIHADGLEFRVLPAHGDVWLEKKPNEAPSKNEDRIEEMIAARSAARAAKNWAEADRIRDELTAMGIQLMDAKDPATGEIVTTWEVKR